jgi:hypothetical protein
VIFSIVEHSVVKIRLVYKRYIKFVARYGTDHLVTPSVLAKTLLNSVILRNVSTLIFTSDLFNSIQFNSIQFIHVP